MADREVPEKQVATDWRHLLDHAHHPVAPPMRPVPGMSEVYALAALFTPTECTALVQAAEAVGFGAMDGYSKKFRGNLRLMVDDEGLAETVWTRIAPHVPSKITLTNGKWLAQGLNTRHRFAKYYPGDGFKEHCDESFVQTWSGEGHPLALSMFTVNVYLSDTFTKGHTRFYSEGASRHEREATAASRMIYSHSRRRGSTGTTVMWSREGSNTSTALMSCTAKLTNKYNHSLMMDLVC